MNNEKYVAQYFKKTKKIIENHKHGQKVLLQFFQRVKNAIFCGINEVLEFLEQNTNVKKYKIRFLEEGSLIQPKEVVLELEGPYEEFGTYEGVIDGILTRATSLATNAKNIIKSSNNKEVIFMGDRSDHYLNQSRDGYAIAIGGIKKQVTDAQISKHEGVALGTVPHVLIQMFEGDVIKAMDAYHSTFPKEPLVALVDFNNDVIGDSLKVLKKFGSNLHAVRVDTSEGVSDKMFKADEEFGVTPNLVKKLREELDSHNGSHVKIIVSSGFDFKKIIDFEKQNTPVDVYGVGTSLLKITNTFTADAVKFNDRTIAKFGRGYKENNQLKIFN